MVWGRKSDPEGRRNRISGPRPVENGIFFENMALGLARGPPVIYAFCHFSGKSDLGDTKSVLRDEILALRVAKTGFLTPGLAREPSVIYAFCHFSGKSDLRDQNHGLSDENHGLRPGFMTSGSRKPDFWSSTLASEVETRIWTPGPGSPGRPGLISTPLPLAKGCFLALTPYEKQM